MFKPTKSVLSALAMFLGITITFVLAMLVDCETAFPDKWWTIGGVAALAGIIMGGIGMGDNNS